MRHLDFLAISIGVAASLVGCGTGATQVEVASRAAPVLPGRSVARAAVTSPVARSVASAAATSSVAPSVASASATSSIARGVDIALSAKTAEQLATEGYYLYGFKAIRATGAAGRPLVWFRTNTYSVTTVVTWNEEYRAYTSLHATEGSVTIDASAAYDIALGQILRVQSSVGTGVVTTDGQTAALSIENQTKTPLTCGIAAGRGDQFGPFCALPLSGGGLQSFTPTSTVLLMFSTTSLAPGTAVEKSSGPAILIDYDGASRRSIAYDIEKGWSWDNATWAHAIPTDTNVVQILVKQ